MSNLPKADKNSNICEECGRTFANGKGKMIHFTRMHANTTENTSYTKGFFSCEDNRCNTCKKGTFGKSIYVSATCNTFTIHQKITCKTANVIYCVTCKKCKEQYIGETENEIHIRQAGHLSDIKSQNMGLPYVRHFVKCGIDNYTITGVEKLKSNDIMIRKSREAYYKKLFKVQIC